MMGNQGEEHRPEKDSRYRESEAEFSGDPELLEKVLRETLSEGSKDSLELIFSVARTSKYEDTTRIGAVEEVVEEIVRRRLGIPKISRRMVRLIAQSLIEVPEAAVKLERIWQEGRFRG